MKIKLTKDWFFVDMSGEKNSYKKGLVLTGEFIECDGVGKNSDVKRGDFHIPHFYCYGQGEVIPKSFFEVLKF